MRIGILGHVGNQNLGDEALIAAVVENVRHRYPEAELHGFTVRPQDTEQRHHLPASPLRRMNGRPATDAGVRQGLVLQLLVRAARRVGRWALALPRELAFLVRSYRTLRGTDLMLVAGSGQLNDYWGGPWGFPLTLFKWSLLARMTGTKVAFLSLGAGPLRTWLGKLFVKHTLRLAHYRSYRDDVSRCCVMALGVSGEHAVVPDLVFSLHAADVPFDSARERTRRVGINPMPFFADTYWPESNPLVYNHYIRTVANFADWLMDSGYGVRFFATQLLVDHGVIGQVRALMRRGDTAAEREMVVADRINSFDELVSVIDSLDIVVATRYHGTLFGLLRHKPVLSIAYQRKSVELMTLMGQSKYAIDIDHLTLEALRERFLALQSQRGTFVEDLRRRLPLVRQALETQYDRAFALLKAAV